MNIDLGATVIALLLPATVAIASTFSAALAIAAIFGGHPQPARSLHVVPGGFLGLMMGVGGPGRASLRGGSRRSARGVAPGKGRGRAVARAGARRAGGVDRGGTAGSQRDGERRPECRGERDLGSPRRGIAALPRREAPLKVSPRRIAAYPRSRSGMRRFYDGTGL